MASSFSLSLFLSLLSECKALSDLFHIFSSFHIYLSSFSQPLFNMQFPQLSQTLVVVSCAFAASAAPAASSSLAAHCTTEQLTASDGRALRFTGGGGSFERGTEQDMSFDIPTGTQLSGLANIYIRDNNGKAWNVVTKRITGGSFFADRDSTAHAEFVVPGVASKGVVAVPVGQYTYWANMRLKSGETCATGSTTNFELK